MRELDRESIPSRTTNSVLRTGVLPATLTLTPQALSTAIFDTIGLNHHIKRYRSYNLSLSGHRRDRLPIPTSRQPPEHGCQPGGHRRANLRSATVWTIETGPGTRPEAIAATPLSLLRPCYGVRASDGSDPAPVERKGLSKTDHHREATHG